MSEAKDPNLLTSEELAALVMSSGADSSNGLSATEARVLYGTSLSVSDIAKHLGALAGTQPDGKTFVVSVDQTSITAFGLAVGSGVSQTLQPPITENTLRIKDQGARLEAATKQIDENIQQIKDLGARFEAATKQIDENIQQIKDQGARLETAKVQIGENAHNIRTQTGRLEKAIAEIGVQEIRTELVALIETEWGERCRLLAADFAALMSRFEEFERKHPATPGESSTRRRVTPKR
jgi:DNA repair exonuclease SbcCD ATPase subunit